MLYDIATPGPADQAARLLLVWDSRDAAGLGEEVRRSLELGCPEPRRSFYEEQWELLQAAARQIRHALDPLEPADAKLQQCRYLLRHLASSASRQKIE